MPTMIAPRSHVRELSHDPVTDSFANEEVSFTILPTQTDGSNGGISEVVSARIDEAEVPGWVYRRFAPLNGEAVSQAAPLRRWLRPTPPASVSAAPTREPCVSDLVYLALARSGYPLRNVRCWCDDQTLVLSGYVSRYFYAQQAVEAARRLAGGRRLEVQIEVIPTAPATCSADE